MFRMIFDPRKAKNGDEHVLVPSMHAHTWSMHACAPCIRMHGCS